MRETERAIEQLNEALECELSAIAQHIVHAEMVHIRGDRRHGLYIKKLAIEEMLNVRVLIARILVLEGVPRVDAPPTPMIGGSFLDQLENDLVAERQAVNQYSSAAAICAQVGDAVSQALLEGIVKEKEAHADYLVAELSEHAVAGLECGAAQRIHSVPDSLQHGSVKRQSSFCMGRELQAAPRK